MRHLKNINIWQILKMLCIISCTVFLLSACGTDNDAATMGPGSDKQETLESQRDCFQASILEVMYNSLGNVAGTVYKNLAAENLLSLLMLAFSVWMAFQILRHVSATTPESLSEFWTKIFRKAAICFACGLLASSQENIYYAVNTFVLPIYVTILEFGSAILGILSTSPGAQITELSLSGDLAQDIGGTLTEPFKHSLNDAQCMITDSTNIEMREGEFPKAPVQLMGCMACSVSDRLNVGYSIAMLMLKSGNLFAVLVSIFLFAVFTIAKWGFALYLVDSIFRLTMMIVIMPFLILFYPFEQTRKWTNIGFTTILNSAAIMLCMAMMVGATVYAMQTLFNTPEIGDFTSKKSFSNFGTVSLTMIFMGFVVIKATGIAVSLSQSVTGGGGATNIQKRAAGIIGTIVNAGLLLLSAGASSAFQFAVKHSQRLREMQNRVNNARAKVSQFKQRLNNLAGRNNNNQNAQNNQEEEV